MRFVISGRCRESMVSAKTTSVPSFMITNFLTHPCTLIDVTRSENEDPCKSIIA